MTLSYETCFILGTPGTAHASSGTFPIGQHAAYTTGGCPTDTEGLPYAPGDCPTVPTAYPASGRAYPLVPCVPSKLTYATERIQPASKGENQQMSEYSEYSEYRGLYVVSAAKGA